MITSPFPTPIKESIPLQHFFNTEFWTFSRGWLPIRESGKSLCVVQVLLVPLLASMPLKGERMFMSMSFVTVYSPSFSLHTLVSRTGLKPHKVSVYRLE